MIEFITHNNSFSVLKIQFSFEKLNIGTWFSHLIRGHGVKCFHHFEGYLTKSPVFLFFLNFLFLFWFKSNVSMHVTFRIVFPDFPIAKIITRERSNCQSALAWLTLVGTRLSAQWRKKLMFLLQSHILEASSQRIWREARLASAAPRAWNYIKILGIVYETARVLLRLDFHSLIGVDT